MLSGLNKFIEIVSPYISETSSKQMNSWDLLLAKTHANTARILDFGSGDGSSINFKELRKKGNITPLLIGLDISNYNKNKDIQLVVYNGNQFPFKNSVFDIVYSKQVLEHVRFPDDTLKEIVRVLKPGGLFIGSVSHTEPYHANSIFNWTPYGVIRVFGDADMDNIQIFPGIDGLTLFLRRFTSGKLGNYFFYHESPLNLIISAFGKACGKTNCEINAIKLTVCGHMCFVARKKN
jgi:SAM-dependent methyltransferase